MLETMISTWWSMTSAYFAAPTALIGGRLAVDTMLATAGIVLLILGIWVAVLWRERQARWLALPAIAAALAPLVVSYIYAMMGWFGVLFLLVLGGVALLGWVGVIASDARRRAPIWLAGFGLLSFVVYCGLLSVAAIWGMA